jgi:hypothetical protein
MTLIVEWLKGPGPSGFIPFGWKRLPAHMTDLSSRSRVTDLSDPKSVHQRNVGVASMRRRGAR